MQSFSGLLTVAILFTCGPPLLGLAASAYLWRASASEPNLSLRRILRFSFGQLALAFLIPLLFDTYTVFTVLHGKSGKSAADSLSALFLYWPFFSRLAALLSLVSAALLLWKCRGKLRIFGPMLAFAALLFSFVNLVFFLAGAAGI
jgi:hypothetical protein